MALTNALQDAQNMLGKIGGYISKSPWDVISQQVKQSFPVTQTSNPPKQTQAPTLSDVASNVRDFVKQYPTPASYIAPKVQTAIQPVTNFVTQKAIPQINTWANQAATNQKQGLYLTQPTPSRVLMTNYSPQIQSVLDKMPKFNLYQGNPIKPQGFQVNTGAMTGGLLDMFTGGAYNPQEKSYYQKLQNNQPLNPQDVATGKNLQNQDMLKFMMTSGGVTPETRTVGRSANVIGGLRETMSGATSAEDAVTKLNNFVDEFKQNADKSQLADLRAGVAKELTNLTGGSGNFKKDYAMRIALRDDPQVGPLVNAYEDVINNIDNGVIKPIKAPQGPGPLPWEKEVPQVNPSLERAKQVKSEYLNPAGGLGQEMARRGYTWDQIIKMKPPEATNIMAGEELTKISKTPLGQKVGIIDYFRTPENVLNKIGLGNEAKSLRTGFEGYQKQLPQELDKITGWMKQVPSQESNTKIFNWLDGVKSDLNPQELKVATEIKSYFKDWANKLEIPPQKRVSDYITHLFGVGQVNQEFDEDLAKIIDPTIAKSVYDPFMLKRTGQRVDYLRDTWGALQAYTKRAVRKFNIDPALEQLSAKEPKLELSQWNYVKRLVDRINMRPTEVDNLIDNFVKSIPGVGYRFGQRPTTTITRGVRQLIYRGALGLNVTSALRNLTQGTNTYAELGERWTLAGYTKLFRNWGSSELKDVGVLSDSFIDQNPTVFKTVLSKIDQGLFSLFEGAEKINRGAAYYGAKAKALAQGKTEQEAIDFGKQVVRKTQFVFGSLDTPQALSSDLSKTIGQFQSYNLKQLEFLIDKAGKKEFGGLLRYIGSMLVVGKVLKDSLGIKLDVLPTGFSLTPSIQLGSSAVQTATGIIQGDDTMKKQGLQGMAKTLPLLIPGGAQAKKTYEGLKTYNQGYTGTDKAIKYPVQHNIPNLIRSAIGGQYATPEAQTYFDTKARPLSASQSQFVANGNNQDANYQFIQDQRAGNKVQAAQKVTDKSQALTLYKQLKPLSPEARKAFLLNGARNGTITKSTLSLLKSVTKEQKIPQMNQFSQAVKLSANTNAGKATYIKQFLTGKTPTERKAYLLQLRTDGVLTKTLLKQLILK